MINFFKKHFIPGEHNDHKPHILKKGAVFFILEIILLVEIVFLIQVFYIAPYTNIFSAVLSNVLVDLTNIDRQSNNIPTLKVSPLLEQAAQMKAEDMAQSGYFSHTSPNGKTPWEWLDEVGYSFKYAGENLAVNFLDSSDIERAWMNSETHKKNIINERFTEIGIATAKGLYKNKETIFVVQFFGRPAAPKTVTRAVGVSSGRISELTIKTEGAVKGEETFAIVENDDIKPAIITTDLTQNKLVRISFLQRVFVMPKTIIDYTYLFIAMVIVVALILKFVVKIKVQYPKLIFNGTIMLFVIISILYFNYLIVGRGSVF